MDADAGRRTRRGVCVGRVSPPRARPPRRGSRRGRRGPGRPGSGWCRPGSRPPRPPRRRAGPSSWVSTKASRRSASSRASRSVDGGALGHACRLAVRRRRSSLEVGVVADQGQPPTAAGADGVGADPAGDGEQPGAQRRPALEAVQRAERPQVGLLRQVVGRLPVAERGAQPPHVGLGGPDERRRGQGIAAGGVGRDALELVHVPIFIGRMQPAPGTGGPRRTTNAAWRPVPLPRGDLRPARRRAPRDARRASSTSTWPAAPPAPAGPTRPPLVTRRARLAAAPPVPDLTAAVLAALPRELPGAAAAARSRLVGHGAAARAAGRRRRAGRAGLAGAGLRGRPR